MTLACTVLCCSLIAAHAAEPTQTESEFFTTKIQPILQKRCFECHSHASGKIKGGLTLDSKTGWAAGGDSGPAIVPGSPEKSLFVKAIQRDGLEMPPESKLPAGEVALLIEWIRRGAFDPRQTVSSRSEKNTDESWRAILAQRKAWWCWQPIHRPALPEASPADSTRKPWSSHPVDQFIDSKMKSVGLTPSPRADRLTLLRRLAFVLTGLPPSIDEVQMALDPAASPENYEALVDRLLASPRFGEHWGRHWLDLVRYSDTHGSEHDPLIPHAWRYRDYVIRAFNDDLPYDRFVREHLAGDRLPPRWNANLGINESLLGTTFFRFVEFYPTPLDAKTEEIDVVDSQIDAATKTFQAITVSCARCHDHKFDAISARDYYALYGIFASTRTTMHRLDDPAAAHATDQQLIAIKQQVRQSLSEFWVQDAAQIPARLSAATQLLKQNSLPKKFEETKSPAERLAWVLQNSTKPEQLLFPFQRLIQNSKDDGAKLAADWQAVAAEWHKRREQQLARNRDPHQLQQLIHFGVNDSPIPSLTKPEAWFASDPPLNADSKSGDFAIPAAGPRMVSGIYPSGRYSFLLSDKHGGSLRSPNFKLTMKFVSVQVCGTNKGRARLVVENFQGDELLYARANPRLNHEDLQWITIPIRPQWEGRRAYLEFVPRDDMTYVGKIADAATLPADGRSGIGICAVVFHDQPNAPDVVSALPESFWATKADWQSACDQLVAITQAAINTWRTGPCTNDNARFLDALLRSGLLANEPPAAGSLANQLAEYRRIESAIPVPRRVPGVADEDGFDEHFFPRGNYRQAGDSVARRYLEVLNSNRFDSLGSGRLHLANQLTSSDNPLTSRVMVNRIWQHLFGVGLVRTPDNFGKLGEPPSHPELLDWLASEFVEQQWSVKQLIRLLVTSQTFQLSTEASPIAKERDPENRWWSHASVRRLSAESIRDSLLEVSGRTNRAMGGLQVPLPYPKTYKDFDPHVSGPIDGHGRRSIYLEARRNYPSPFLQAFDQPRPIATTGRRNVTNVPAQSLTLLNDPFVHQQAEHLAKRTLAVGNNDQERIRWLYLETVRRPPTADELQRATAFLAEQSATYDTSPMAPSYAWQDLAHAMLNSKEFIYFK